MKFSLYNTESTGFSILSNKLQKKERFKMQATLDLLIVIVTQWYLILEIPK